MSSVFSLKKRKCSPAFATRAMFIHVSTYSGSEQASWLHGLSFLRHPSLILHASYLLKSHLRHSEALLKPYPGHEHIISTMLQAVVQSFFGNRQEPSQ
ncbi:MAG TPA: hypothetical protein VNT20_04150 [Flavisolibacter sp.]|nr:hypothetical protein [Flavisolibacter sp.]